METLAPLHAFTAEHARELAFAHSLAHPRSLKIFTSEGELHFCTLGVQVQEQVTGSPTGRAWRSTGFA
jgi:hypothetical protein